MEYYSRLGPIHIFSIFINESLIIVSCITANTIINLPTSVFLYLDLGIVYFNVHIYSVLFVYKL